MDGGVDRIDNPLASDVESPAAATSLETGTGIITVEQKLAEMEARLQKVADSGGNNVLSTAAALASLASAPTNWHQAMIYFLTSTAEEDASMRKKAPAMYAMSVAMVLMQFFTVCGIVTAMLHPSCVTNAQCNERAGFYCYMGDDADIGSCQMCGEAAPLPPYRSDEVYTDPERGEVRKEFNNVWDQHYPQDAKGKRMETPLGFAGFNFTMVQQRCTIPIRGFRWDYSGERENTVVVDRGDIDRDYPWLPNERLQPWNSLMFTKFSSASASRWCAACVETVPFDEEDGLTMTDDDTGLTVSIMNKKLLAMTNTKAMAKLDWVALLMSAYVVGLMVSGEIKDIVLCEIQAQKNAHKLTAPWQLALEALNCLRSQFFLAPLMGATPAIVVTQGGSALAICFNTIAILFIMDVDNLSYSFGLGERARERVDSFGVVELNDSQAQRLHRTKMLSVSIVLVVTLWLVDNGASVAAMLSGHGMALAFKLSELIATYSEMSRKDVAVFVATSLVVQWLSYMFFIYAIILPWYEVKP